MQNATTQDFELTLRPTSDRLGYIVSVVGGPQDLIKRGSEEAALRDGRAYVQAHWEQTAEGWRPRPWRGE